MEDTNIRILRAAIKGVRIYGLEGIRIQNIADLANLTPGAIYRHFDSKDALLKECFLLIDKQVAALFDEIEIQPQDVLADPVDAIRQLWTPYFRFWTARPDETVFYNRFRDSASFTECFLSGDDSYCRQYHAFIDLFRKTFPGLSRLNTDILRLHLAMSTVMIAQSMAEGILPNNEETEEAAFRLLTNGIIGYLSSE